MKVCAVVVTYNRKELLVRSLTSIMAQINSKLDKIFIIDNASTDGTKEYIQEKGILSSDLKGSTGIEIEYICLDSNLGGAGGFHKGLEIAHAQKYEYYWVMDDDGYPSENCLSELLKYTNGYDFLSPLVLNELDYSRLSFGINGIFSREEIEEKYYTSEVIVDKANPFNGVLFSKLMLDKIGYPKADMFIWGDENEYQQRAFRSGLKIGTVKNAIHYHPSNRVKFKVIFGNLKVNLPEGNLRRYCYFRNYTYILKKYGTNTALMKWFVKYTCLFLMTFDLKGFSLFVKASLHALRNDFTHHRDYLK